jgi:transcriptional/translational regulatory protein YebC/TACO1
MGESGCVSWMFARRGVITLDATKVDEDAVMEAALEVGAEDVSSEDGIIEVLCEYGRVTEIKEALEARGLPIESAEVSMVPENMVSLDGKQAESCMKLIETIEENEDVQDVYTNADIPEEIMAGM